MPTGRDLHIDRPLTNVLVKAFEGASGYIAQRLLPVVSVGKQSDKYYTLAKNSWIRVPDTRRAPKTPANRIEFDVSSNSYFADNYALAGDIPLEDISNADDAVMLRQNTTMNVTEGLLRDLEVRVANLVTSGTNCGSYVSLSGGNKWSDAVNSSPLSDVTTGHAFIRQNTGLMANTLVVDEDTLAIARRHPELLDFYKYTRGGEITNAELAAVFHVDQILVGKGIKNNAVEGATASITNIWGNNVLLAHIKPGMTLQTATFGLSFRWRPGGFPAPMQASRTMDNDAGGPHIETIEACYYQDEKIVASDLGYLIASTL